jgi:hypothetical protein
VSHTNKGDDSLDISDTPADISNRIFGLIAGSIFTRRRNGPSTAGAKPSLCPLTRLKHGFQRNFPASWGTIRG